MPLSFAAQMGGMLSLMGCSTMMVARSALAATMVTRDEEGREKGYDLDFFTTFLPASVIGLITTLFVVALRSRAWQRCGKITQPSANF